MKVQHIFIIVLTLISNSVFAQNIGEHSQLIFAKSIVYPAAYDSNAGSDIWINHREQWVNIDNAPSSSILGTTIALKDETMTLGGNVFNYKQGVFSNSGIKFNYSFNVMLTDEMNLRFG